MTDDVSKAPAPRTARPHRIITHDRYKALLAKHRLRQIDVARDVAAQIKAGGKSIFGVMVESHLVDGAQKFTPGKDDAKQLEYGKSITDACLGWDDSLTVLEVLSEAVKTARG